MKNRNSSSSSQFARGSGVYSCVTCGRRTRATGRGDNENSGLCAECYDLGGESNSLCDDGKLYDAGACRSAIAKLTARGIDAEALFPEVAAELARLAVPVVDEGKALKQARADGATAAAAALRAEASAPAVAIDALVRAALGVLDVDTLTDAQRAIGEEIYDLCNRLEYTLTEEEAGS